MRISELNANPLVDECKFCVGLKFIGVFVVLNQTSQGLFWLSFRFLILKSFFYLVFRFFMFG